MAAPVAAGLNVRDVVKSDDPSTWDECWKINLTPWDVGQSQPPLQDVVECGEIPFPTQGRILVPGCGRGYDVIYLATKLNSNAFGLDISETAHQAAKTHLASVGELPEGSSVTYKIQDFFEFRVAESERFDLVYDYTFFVAIPPPKRPQWGEQMAALIKPGGYLITLVYPIDPPVSHGPPWFLRPDHYDGPLGSNFVKVLDKVPENSLPSHVGRDHIMVWKRV
ncbi:S-adenosyl-L-methionine-dependent methyltransferase [Pluteus cervinus]|uniref:S-adenosyl-L-methionine-dependent methyltransferase n=1 Tax=Pluteus cervinus TaxID=181527 RepID=A0ACD3ANS3_9AGAR|nr:S-adenosyl-L-methionine-dependent methyltransferase [Pluteus cervinus]